MSAHVARQRPRTRKDKRRKLLWLTEAQAALGWAVLLALAAVLGAIYLHQTSEIARVGRTVQSLQYQTDEVKRANSSLELDIARAQSLPRLKHQAEQMKFVPAASDNIEYIVVHNYPPSQESTELIDPLPEPVVIDTAAEAILRALAARFGDLTRGESE